MSKIPSRVSAGQFMLVDQDARWVSMVILSARSFTMFQRDSDDGPDDRIYELHHRAHSDCRPGF
jgi:hypothetical protein